MRITYSRYSKKWLCRNNVCIEALTLEIKKLCTRIGRISHRNIYIYIKKFGIDSEFDCRGNRLILGNFASKGHSQRYRVKCLLIALLHELRHFMQIRMLFIPKNINYTVSDMLKNNSRYYNDPAEVDARRFEKKYIARVLRKVYIKHPARG